MLIYSSRIDELPDDPAERYGRLLFELGDTIASVRCDWRLAMYRAHQNGMDPVEIAQRAHADLSDVQDAIVTLRGEPEVDEWQIARWVPRYFNDQ
ncbi:hypothetical protein [Flindersiella endophytica]